MNNKNNSFKSFIAIFKASMQAILSNPSAIFFSFIFPLIFVFIFGSFGKDGLQLYSFVVEKNIDTSDTYYQVLKKIPNIQLITETADNKNKLDEKIKAGKITGWLKISKASAAPFYSLNIKTYDANILRLKEVMPILEKAGLMAQQKIDINYKSFLNVETEILSTGKKRSSIDFILPGQIGFSLIFSTLFGIAFGFYNLRQQLVLKRMFATPTNRLSILLGIGCSRLLFQLINVILLILFGYFLLDFNLANGFVTFIEMVVLSIIFLILLLGVALIISSIAKTDTVIPLLINLFGLPQLLLGGTFFPITAFPVWMQNICKFLPVYNFNEAMRIISFDGKHLWDVAQYLGILGVWIIVIYIITFKVFKWN